MPPRTKGVAATPELPSLIRDQILRAEFREPCGKRSIHPSLGNPQNIVQLDDRVLKDIGLSRSEIALAARNPEWGSANSR